MTAPRLCDEDVHLASEESSRHEDIGQKSSLHEVTLTRARALLSEWGFYRYQWRLCQPESHSGPIQFLYYVLLFYVCVLCMYVYLASSGAYALTGQVIIYAGLRAIDVDDIAYRPRPCIWTYKGPAPVASDKRTAEIFTKRRTG